MNSIEEMRNSPEKWLDELRDKRRYPGIISIHHVEALSTKGREVQGSGSFSE